MKLNQKSLADVEIGFPVIQPGVYHARINKPEIKDNKQKDGNNLVISFTILDNPLLLNKDGKQIENKGRLKLTRYISLKPTPDYDPDERIKELQVAIKFSPEQDVNVDDLTDKIVMVKVEYRPERDNPDKPGSKYPESNEIGRITPVPEDDMFTPPPF